MDSTHLQPSPLYGENCTRHNIALRDPTTGRYRRYILSIQWNLKTDQRGLQRAYRCNGWLKGAGISLDAPLDQQTQLRQQLIDRLQDCFGLLTLKNHPIFRYQLVQMLSNMTGWRYPLDDNGYLLDCHHIDSDSTNDIRSNLILMYRSDHRAEHSLFECYNSLDRYRHPSAEPD
jgi:hypothetical protein